MTAKRFLAAVVAATAATFALPPAWAAEPPRQIRADLHAPSLVVHLDADGSLVVSQRGKAAGGVLTLPSIEALPAEIDTLVPRKENRKKIAVAADPAVTWRDFSSLMNDARKAGFAKVGVLGLEKESRGDPSELAIRISYDLLAPDLSKALFVSLGSDGAVIVSLGIGADARGTRVNLADASDAAAGLAPKERAKKDVYFRADFDAHVGDALEVLRKLRAMGFTKVNVVAEATD
jgi:biopolymer transport protein ExbD